jgi:hypothetical protein
VGGRVDAEQLVDDAEAPVAGDLQREQARRADAAAAVEPDQRGGEREVPQQLIEERRMEGRIGELAVGPVVAVDLERPRQVRGPPEQLLVEVVADPSDRLGDEQRRGGRVQEVREPGTGAPDAP